MSDAPEGRIAIVGGGAAAFFAALACAETNPRLRITILERAAQFLAKVKISGGGRCNVTHACSDARQMAAHYPRGAKALVALLHRFSAEDTESWFRERGVALKVEADGRLFPISDSSQTVIDCFHGEASRLGVTLLPRSGVHEIRKLPEGGFDLISTQRLRFDKVLIATGGCRTPGSVQLLESLGHRVNPPVPSLFSLHVPAAWLHELAGISLREAEISVARTKLRETGPVLITHTGLSGPAVLRLSAWGARPLHEADYHVEVAIKWLPWVSDDQVREKFRSLRETHPNRHVVNSPLEGLPARLWETLVQRSSISPDVRWTTLSREQTNSLIENLLRTRLPVTGKSLNKDEFVTCGGVDLREVDPRTMQSRITPGLFFAGEVLDIDGITGGFNFQAAWTTGWIAGKAMAADQ